MEQELLARLQRYAQHIDVASWEVVSLKIRPVRPNDGNWTDPFGEYAKHGYMYESEYAAAKEACHLVQADEQLADTVGGSVRHPSPWSTPETFIFDFEQTTPPTLWVQHETGLEIIGTIGGILSLVTMCLAVFERIRSKVKSNTSAPDSDRHWRDVNRIRIEVRSDRGADLYQELVYSGPIDANINTEHIQKELAKALTALSYKTMKILFLAANPIDTVRLRLDAEVRAIDASIHQADFRDRIHLEQHSAVRVTDLQALLLRHRPDVVHFSGHGSQTAGIILEDENGRGRIISISAVATVFAVLRDNIKCIVLNACFSEPQALAIAAHIDCVIGMSQAISDSAALSFASAFYQALGYGRDIQTAFDLGCAQIDLEGLGQQDRPRLIALNSDPRRLILAV